jgi:hypothetical protein
MIAEILQICFIAIGVIGVPVMVVTSRTPIRGYWKG